MLIPIYDPAARPELTAEQIAGMAATVARVKAALADIVARKCGHPQGLIRQEYLTRDGLDAAVDTLAMPPVSDQEWAELHDRRGGTG